MMYLLKKNIGETPLEALEKARMLHGISTDIPMTYAGRLDPMAEGLMIILIGEECKNKEKYLGFDKEYEVEVLFGVQTDSYDALGLIEKVNDSKEINFSQFVGKFNQEYPRYSSRVIAMKDMPEEMPTKDVEIYSIEKLEERNIEASEISKQVIEKIEKVKGDFRQKEIIEKWQEFANQQKDTSFKIVKIRVNCSSGTYMRSLAHNAGGLAFSIKRTKIGNYSL